MKPIASIFLISSLLFSNSVNGQRGRLFSSIEEALTVSADSVYRLNLSKKKLTSVPLEILQFKNLQELDLSKNKLTVLPTSFYFDDLRILNLTKNNFVIFPDEIVVNLKIRHLFLGKNSIPNIPESIGDLQNLIILDLWYNPISDLPNSLTKLRNLRSLDLSGLNFSNDFQKKWNALLPWVTIEFEAACDCAN